MSLSRAAGAASGASRVFVPGHCPCCSDGVAVAVAAVAVAAVVLVVTVVAVAVAVAAAASWSCMAAERASTLSAAESMAYGGEGEGGSCYLALGRCRGSSHISPAISSTARYINSHFVSPSPSPPPQHAAQTPPPPCPPPPPPRAAALLDAPPSPPLPAPPRMCHHRLPRRPRHTTHKQLQKCMYCIHHTIYTIHIYSLTPRSIPAATPWLQSTPSRHTASRGTPSTPSKTTTLR